ncbi:uncharacterized protein LOC143275728 [Babylonia areolata]|uniref:uncharacterized protein LOC143275728 n=1 Tax=Babylonia areolata TaxID=304850 RepID=UPI003FCFEB73
MAMISTSRQNLSDEEHNVGTPSRRGLRTAFTSSHVSLTRCHLFLFTVLLLSLGFLLLLVQPSRSLTFFPLGGPASYQSHSNPSVDHSAATWGLDTSTDPGLEGGGGRPTEGLVKQLVKKYRVDFNALLAGGVKRSAWQVAADWVKEREVLPSRAPELVCGDSVTVGGDGVNFVVMCGDGVIAFGDSVVMV